MEKLKKTHVLFVLIPLGIIVFFYMYVGYKFGVGVSKFGKDLHEVKKEWKKNNENPLDSIKNKVINTMTDSINKRENKNKVVN